MYILHQYLLNHDFVCVHPKICFCFKNLRQLPVSLTSSAHHFGTLLYSNLQCIFLKMLIKYVVNDVIKTSYINIIATLQIISFFLRNLDQ